MKITKELIDQVKRVDFKQFLEHEMGFTFKKTGNYYECIEHDSFNLIYGKDNNLYYTWNSCTQYGDIIEFVKQNICGNFEQAVLYLNGIKYSEIQHSSEKKNYNSLSKATCIKPQNEINLQIQYNSDMKRTFAYLHKTRGISINTISTFVNNNLISEDTRHNIVFKHLDFNGNLSGGELKGTNTYKPFCSIIKGSDEQFGFSYKIGCEVKAIYVFEAVTDLLSFYDMYKSTLENCLLLAINGVTKINKINTYLDKYKSQTIIVCVDNDKAGNEMLNKIYKRYDQLEIIDYRDVLKIKNVKDYNELLLLNR